METLRMDQPRDQIAQHTYINSTSEVSWSGINEIKPNQGDLALSLRSIQNSVIDMKNTLLTMYMRVSTVLPTQVATNVAAKTPAFNANLELLYD